MILLLQNVPHIPGGDTIRGRLPSRAKQVCYIILSHDFTIVNVPHIPGGEPCIHLLIYTLCTPLPLSMGQTIYLGDIS